MDAEVVNVRLAIQPATVCAALFAVDGACLARLPPRAFEARATFAPHACSMLQAARPSAAAFAKRPRPLRSE